MSPIVALLALCSFAVAASLGVVVHECAHAATLRAFGVPYHMEWFPEDPDRSVHGAAVGAFARVTPVDLPADCPAWRLRVSAMAPLVLLAPFALVATGVVGDPFAGDAPVATMVAAGWLACAVPSPADFSLLWHAEEAIEERTAE